jgi:hypothetical protein
MDHDKMARSSTAPVPDNMPLNHNDILVLARLADLHLPAAYQDELVEAYGHIHSLVACLPRSRPRGDEPAHIFNPLGFCSGQR